MRIDACECFVRICVWVRECVCVCRDVCACVDGVIECTESQEGMAVTDLLVG